MKVLVVDDEVLARDELKYLLRQHADVEVVGEASCGSDAVLQIKSLHPDVVFLDVQMPEVDGLSVARNITHDGKPFLVFATAYSQYAVEAFDLEAVDYILKPFSAERISETLKRLRKVLKETKPVFSVDIVKEALQTLKQQDLAGVKRISVTDENRTILINPHEIVFVSREGRNVWIHLVGKRYRSNYTIQELEDKLKDYSFFRTHRAYLANLKYVSEISPWFNGAYQLVMDDSQHSLVPVSRNTVKDLWGVLDI